MNKRILIVEDDDNIIRLECDYLKANGFDVDTAKDGKNGLQMALTGAYNLIILDIMVPEINGMEICKKVRQFCDIPILLVSAKRDEMDKIMGLQIGADDYIVKPFSPSELVARVIAHIKRYERLTTAHGESPVLEFDSLKIDKTSRRVTINNTEISLTNKEFDLLACLAESPDTVFNKDDLFQKIWQSDPMGETSTVTVHVNRVREKISAVDPTFKYINTIWGKGYRFNK